MAEFEFPVDRSAILDFAAALGETNPIYWDEVHASKTPLGAVIAPPTFAVVSAHWNPDHAFKGIRKIPQHPRSQTGAGEPRARRAEGGGAFANLSRVLHGEQRFVYHQPIRPGMRLSVTTRPGKSWEKEGKRGGKLRFSETVSEYRDERGELVVTAISVGIVTEKAVEA
jgi:hypothetical protein